MVLQVSERDRESQKRPMEIEIDAAQVLYVHNDNGKKPLSNYENPKSY